jgi:hypothetical protein
LNDIENDVNAGHAGATLESEKKLASVVEQVNTLIGEQLKSLKRINDEYTKQLGLLENQKKLDNDIFAAKKTELDQQTLQLKYLQDIANLSKNIQYSEKLSDDEKTQRFADIQKSLLENNRITQEEIDEHKDIIALLETRIDLAEKERVKAQETVKFQEDLNSQVKTTITSWTHVSDNWKGSAFGLFMDRVGKGDMSTALNTLGASIAKNFTITNALGSTIKEVGERTHQLAKAQDEALSSLAKTTLGAKDYNSLLIETERRNYTFGISTEEVTQAVSDLSVRFRGFRDLTEENRARLTDFTAQMTRVGVSTSTTALIFQTLEKGLGMTYEASEKATREILATGKALNLGGQQIMSMFEQMAPRLAAFGKDAPRVFKELAVVMSNTGIEMSRLLSLSEKFDTFEGAAASVGKLNSILGGGFLDTMQMVQTTNPAERFELIKGAIDRSGKSFESMGYYMKKSLADAAGFSDVNDFAQMMTANLNKNTAAAREKALTDKQMADVMQSVQTIGEKVTALWKSMAINLSVVLGPIRSVLDGLLGITKAMGGWSALLIPVVTVFGATLIWLTKTAISGLVSKSIDAVKGVTGLGGAAKKMAEEVGTGAAPITRASSAAKSASLSMFGLAVAAVGVGFGFYLAGKGIAEIARAMDGMSAGAMIATTVIVGMVAAIMIVSTTATASALGLGILAVTFAAIGASFWLIGKGISMIRGESVESTRATADLTSALNSISSSKASDVARAVKDISKSVADIPDGKTFAITTMMQSAGSVTAETAANVERLVASAVRYKTVQEESRTQVVTQFTKMLETAVSAPAGASSEGSGNQTVVLKVDGDILGKLIGKVVGKTFKQVLVKS